MKINFLFALLLSLILTVSCSEDDGPGISPQFEFLEFEKDVILPAVNDRSFTFLAGKFDPNIDNWEVSLQNQDNQDIPVSIRSIVDTPYGITIPEELFIQRVTLNLPPFGEGTYTLTIKNKTTNQTYKDIFLVKSGTFNRINYDYISQYNLINETERTQDYFYYPNIVNTIENTINNTGISSVRLENKTTFETIDIGFDLQQNTGKVQFTIPNSVPQGIYYLSVQYNNLINTYFEKDIIILKEQLPEITSINKNSFMGGEQMIITGKNFSYVPDFSNIDASPFLLRYFSLSGGVLFDDGGGSGAIFAGIEDENLITLNDAGTEFVINIPTNKGDDFFFSSDNDRSYFEGEISVINNPYTSNTISIRIDY